jgi:predicted MFS family arabinose efflux permease
LTGKPAAVPGRPARAAVTAYFALYGVVLAVWVTRLPAIKQQLRLSDGLLGLALLAIPAGVLAVTLIAGRIVDRAGSARLTRAGGIAMALLLLGPAVARGLWSLAAVLLAFGVAAGALNVGMNANGVALERVSGRRIITSLHAAYSLGALAGAVLGGLSARAGLSPLATFAATGLPAAAVAAAAGRWLVSRDLERDATPASTRHQAGPGAGAAQPVRGEWRGQRRGRWRGHPAAMVALLGAIGLCALLGEGAVADWSAVYLRDTLGTSAAFAALGYAGFSVAMAAGRLAGDRLADRFGPVWLVRGGSLIAAAGLAAGLASGSPVGGVAGFAVLGAGLSGVAPQVFLAGSQADPARPGHGLARVVGLSYLGMVGGPPAVGGLASLIGLRLALWLPVALILASAALAGTVSAPAAARSN